ncbi:MAG: AzlC family ABC transporter permease [Spirochaetota bacterium]
MKQHRQLQELLEGIRSGFPICIGYFPAAIAFGLVAKEAGLLFFDTVLFSVTNFAGASQFFAVNLIAAGALATEVAVGVFLVNLRYLLMSASLAPKLESQNPLIRALLAFGNTDEVFTVASAQRGVVSTGFMVGISTVSWLGWVGGTITGFAAGALLPGTLQRSVGITLYAMFTALLTAEIQQEKLYVAVALLAALINSVAILIVKLPAGWAFALSMTAASAFGTVLLLKGETRI